MSLAEKKIYPKFRARGVGGQVVFEEPRRVGDYLTAVRRREEKEEWPLVVTIKRFAKDRSRQEEKFYHAVVVRMIADAMSMEDQEAHDFLKRMWLKTEERYQHPETRKIVRYERVMSTTELSDAAYRMYWEQCIRWAALPTLPDGLGINSGLELIIPYPNEVDYDHF